MASLQDQAIRRVDMYQFDPAKIEVEPGYNVRVFNSAADEDDASLKESIRTSGVRSPLTIRLKGERVVVVAGHRRLAAVRELIAEGVEIKAVPCLPEAKGTSEEDRTLDLIRSNSGKPLTPLEKAEVFKRLVGFGWDEAQIAAKLGCSRTHVCQMLQLGEAPREIRAMIQAGEVAASLAARVIREQGDGAGDVLTTAVAEAKAAGKAKVSQRKVVAKVDAKPTEDESDFARLRRDLDEALAALEGIAGAADVEAARKIARRALGWPLD